jgi:hypothetical protein
MKGRSTQLRLARSGICILSAVALAASCSSPSAAPASSAPAEVQETSAPTTTEPQQFNPATEAAGAATTSSTTVPPEPTAYERALERFASQRERSLADRPDEHEGPMMKFLYVVPSFATDRERDVNGEIASYVFHMNEWIASQNGGFGVRVDTFEGALDVPFTTIETTPEEWDSWFGESLAPAAQRLISQGWPIGRDVEANGDDLYYVVWEAFAGNYLKTGQGGGGCRGVIDGTNAQYRMVGFAVANPGDSPCRMDYGRFPFAGDMREQRWFLESNGQPEISFVDHSLQMMRGLPDCGLPESPFDGELHTVPGTDIVEIRGGFIRDLLENNDPVGMRMGAAPQDSIPELDVRHNTYFHITTGRLARTACNSDAARHPMWSDMPFYADSPTVPRRSVLDRPDDVEGRQLHAVYVKAVGVPDRALDTGLELSAALRDFDAWLRQETGGIGVRLDTFEGHLDVTYLPLPMTAEEFVESGDCAGEVCPSDIDFERILIEAGYHDPEKTYAFFYDGGISPPGLCGGARNDSRSLLINLNDFTAGTCPSPWRAESLDVFSLGHLVGHELMHTLGAVCQAAAKADDGYHSTDSVDLMYGRADGPGQRLDPDRDSYWGPGAPAGCDVSTDGIFTSEANLEPLDGTTLDSVPVGFTDMQPSERTWWLNTGDASSSASPTESTGSGASSAYSSDLLVSVACNETGGSTAVTFTGRLSGGDVADQPVAVIWIPESAGRCIAASTTSSESGQFTLELPEEAHRTAAWEDGGGYCVVWDANGDGVFDSDGEPLDCTTNLAVGQTINWTLRR